MRVHDQPVAEALDAVPHAEALREDHVRLQAVQLRGDAGAVTLQLAQVELVGVDVLYLHLADAERGIEDGRRVRMEDHQLHLTTARQVLGQQARMPLHAAHGLGEDTVGAEGDVHHPRVK